MDNNENTFDFGIIQLFSPTKEADVETSYYCVSFSFYKFHISPAFWNIGKSVSKFVSLLPSYNVSQASTGTINLGLCTSPCRITNIQYPVSTDIAFPSLLYILCTSNLVYLIKHTHFSAPQVLCTL